MVIRSSEMHTPADCKTFLNNCDNKERLFEIIKEDWIKNRCLLDERTIYFARGSICTKIARHRSTEKGDSETDHEEAHTKIAYLLQHAVKCRPKEQQIVFVVRSSSDDIDILVILLEIETRNNIDIFIDNGSGKSKKMLDLRACTLSNLQNRALLGLHAFKGNYYILCFLREGKHLCWKYMNKCEISWKFSVF